MNRRLSDEAYSFYVALGPKRSYAAVAAQFGVSTRTVASTAKREGWQARLTRAQEKAAATSDVQAAQTLAQMNEQHLRIGKYVMGKGLEALRSMMITKPRDALRAIEQGIQHERDVMAPPQGAFTSMYEAREQARLIRDQVALMEASVPAAPEADAPT